MLTRFLSREEVSLGSIGPWTGKPATAAVSRRISSGCLLLTGCRRSEIVRLRWSEVDRDKLVLADSKTGPRTVPLNTQARRILERRPARRKPLRLSVPERPRPAPQPKPFVLVSRPARGGHRGRSPSRSSAYPCQPRGDERHARFRSSPGCSVIPMCASTLRYAHLGDREIEAGGGEGGTIHRRALGPAK